MLIKLKANIPEIILGVFLTVAIFAMGMLFASSQKPSTPTQQVSSTKSADQAKTPDADLTGSTWLTKDAAGFFTFALVWVGGIQAWFFWVQLRLIRASLVDAKTAAGAAERAAKATEDAVELSRKTAQQQLRAYLFIKTPRILVFAHNKKCWNEVWVRNYGQTPAHDVEVVTNTDFLEPNTLPFPELEKPKELSKSSLAPAGEVTFTTATDDPLTADQVGGVASGNLAFFVWGEIRYTDVFGCPQTTHFRLRFGKAQLDLGSGTMMVCDEGNQAT
jgi:hypothetical protein